MKLSVLMPIYAKESPLNLSECLASLAGQTLAADEVVVVKDGPLGAELDRVLSESRWGLPLVSLALPEHAGLGRALRAGMSLCRGDYVARVDSDDICLAERLQKQVEFLDSHREIDVVGSAIEEFDSESREAISIRALPASGSELLRFAQYRNPLNHMTTMFRTESVLAAGSYQHFPGFEDYHLWARMLKRGHRLHNIQQILVHARCGKGLQIRRGGLAYLKQEIRFQRFLQELGIIAGPACIRNILLRGPIRLAPAFLRAGCYKTFLRSFPLHQGELNHG